MSVMTPSLTPARALKRHRLRADPRILLGILLIVLAIAGGLAWAGSVNQGRGVIVATRDLPVGAIISLGDLSAASARLDDRVYAAAIPASDIAALIGRPVAEPIHAHQQLVWGQVGTGPVLAGDQGAMTVAVRAEAAAGGRLKPGDQVQVIVTLDKGKPTSRSEIVIDRATVYAIGREERTRFVGGTAGTTGEVGGAAGDAGGALASVTLIATTEQRLALAQAKWDGEVDLVLLPPATPGAGGR